MKYWVWRSFSTVVTESYPIFINYTNMNIHSILSIIPDENLWIYCWRHAKYFLLQNKTRTLFKNSFFPSTIIYWKNVNQKIRNSAMFLETAISDYLIPKGLFNSHDPKRIRFIVRPQLILVTFRSTDSDSDFNIYYTIFEWLVRC